MLVVCLLMCLALSVTAKEADRQRFWCSRFLPDNQIELTELQGEWQPLNSLLFDDGQLSLASFDIHWKDDNVGPVTLNVTDKKFQLTSTSPSDNVYKNIIFRQRDNQKARFYIINMKNQNERKELLILASDSAKYMVWADCAPPSDDVKGHVPAGARVVVTITVLGRTRDSLSPGDHEQLRTEIKGLLQAREVPVALFPDFTAAATGVAVTAWVMFASLILTAWSL